MTRMLEYTVWLDPEEYEDGHVKIEDLPGFIELDFKGEASF